MKKVLLGLTTLLLISCVNLNEPKVQKVENNPKSVATKNSVVTTQKDDKKKNVATNNAKVIKTRNLLKEAEAIPEDTYANKIKKYKAYKSLTAYNPSYKAKLSPRMNELLNKIEKTYNFDINGADLIFQSILDNKSYNNIENKVFTYSSDNPDVTLQIEMSSISSFRIDKKKQIPSDEKEKHIPAKEEIYKAAFQEMFDVINKDINSLPSLK